MNGRARIGLVALVVGLAGCGGHGGRVTHAPAGSYVSAGARWVVPVTDGTTPPSVALENRERGTRAWRLPGPADRSAGGVARGPVAGYVATQAVAAGDVQRIYVSAPGARTVRVNVYRMGWYGGTGGRLVLTTAPLPARRQPACAHRALTGLTECRWHATVTFAIPPALPSGVYIAKLTTPAGAARDCLFVVRGSGAPLLAVIPTASYEAYNAWGGDSLYPGGTRRVGVTGTDQGVEVSYDRPYDSNTGAGQFFARDVAMVRFLERYGYPVQYTTIESIDADPGQVSGRRALLDVGHSEYWSAGDARAFGRARDRGTSLVFLSSDTLAWRVRFAPATRASSEAGRRDHRIEGYKEHVALDPVHSVPSGQYPGLGASLTGSAYEGCITPRVPGPGPPVYRYYAWAPAAGLRPAWLFAGTGIRPATRVPGIVGYEVDQRTASTPPGTQLIGSGTPACMPAAGLRGRLAETTLYTARSGALVFATGTLGWELGLYPVPGASPDTPQAPDPRLVRMTRNLLEHALKSSGPG